MRRFSLRVILATASLLVVATVLHTSVLLSPAVASSATQETGTRAETLSTSVEHTAVLTFSRPVDHVAAYWQGAADAHVTLAFLVDGERFAPAVEAGRDDTVDGSDGGTTYGAVLDAGGAATVRISTDTPLEAVHILGMTSDSTEEDAPEQASLLLPAAAIETQPPIISRAGWGADPDYLNWSTQFYPPKKIIVHHTEDGSRSDGSPEYYAGVVRSIYYYHAVTRDWGDIAYNFLIDPLGNIYEGRYSDGDSSTPVGEDAFGNGVRGGHTYNYNSGTVGIAVLGSYTNKDISPAARASLVRLLAYVTTRHGIDPVGSGLFVSPGDSSIKVETWNIAGHRDYGSTSCPGDVFYGTLPSIRQDVFELTGPVTAPTPSPTYLRVEVLASSPLMGQDVTVRATLTEESSRRSVAGKTLSFATGGIASAQTSIGSAVTGADGVATLQMTFTAAGMRWVTATFTPGPDAAYRGSTSSTGISVAPSGLSARAAKSTVELSWDASPEAAGYNVYRDGSRVNSETIKTSGFVDSGLSNGITYSYQITAVVSGRESAKSPAMSATPRVDVFLDISNSHPYHEAISGLAAAAVIDGKTDGRFYADDLVTRQQFAKMIVLGCEYPVSEADVCSFGDVAKNDKSLYPDNYVAVCADHGITVGKTETKFDPWTNITRAQVATMVVRAARDSKPSALEEPPATWKGELLSSDRTHGANVALAEYSGLFAGIDLATFSVGGYATRGEIAQIVWNLREK